MQVKKTWRKLIESLLWSFILTKIMHQEPRKLLKVIFHYSFIRKCSKAELTIAAALLIRLLRHLFKAGYIQKCILMPIFKKKNLCDDKSSVQFHSSVCPRWMRQLTCQFYYGENSVSTTYRRICWVVPLLVFILLLDTWLHPAYLVFAKKLVSLSWRKEINYKLYAITF